MKGMVFIDSNVPMYLLGTDHPNKDQSRKILETLVAARRRLVTSAEVLQEICHGYCAINRREYIQKAFDAIQGIVDQIFPITREDVERSKTILLGYHELSARDALHVALMQNLGIQEIFSFDSDFDRFPWINRIR